MLLGLIQPFFCNLNIIIAEIFPEQVIYFVSCLPYLVILQQFCCFYRSIIYSLQKNGATSSKTAELNQEIAYEGIELIFAILLIAFVDGIAEMAKEKEDVGLHAISTFYLFAWLVVDGALLTPELIVFPQRIFEVISVRNVFYFLEFSFLSLALLCFLATVFFSKKGKIWGVLMVIGIVAIGLSIPCSIAQDYLPYEGYVSVLETISQIAPLAPVVFSLISQHDVRKLRKTVYKA